jgi:cyclohexanone monooxygenase
MAALQTDASDLDVVVVGAGFSGLYLLHRLRRLGLRARAYERGTDVGGTWYWNRYPGARCDVESIDYAYAFSPELLADWVWTERYASQPEILRYLEHVADRFDLRRDIRFETTITEAVFDDDAHAWALVTNTGERVTAPICVLAVGNLSSVKRPDFAGLDTFRGAWYHTAEWPHAGVDFTGLRVGVVGTGSTAIQSVPQIARQARHLYVFQRTANYSMPAHNGPLDPAHLAAVVAEYPARRRAAELSEPGIPVTPPTRRALDVDHAERERTFEAGWAVGGIGALTGRFSDIFSDEDANRMAQEFARRKIRAIVHDPAVAELLSPRHFIGMKRTCVDTGYYETYNRPNVELVDIRSTPIEAITPRGIRTAAGEYEVDAIVFAIGFDAMTGALLDIDIRGAGGRALREHWADGPRTYLGLAIAGFPNLFTVTGPGSPGVLSNMALSIEQHVDWITDCLTWMRVEGVTRIDATPAAEAAWVEHVNDLAEETLYTRSASWYMGSNIPGKPRVFMPYVGGCGRYRRRCDEVAAGGYAGFTTTRRSRPASVTVG